MVIRDTIFTVEQSIVDSFFEKAEELVDEVGFNPNVREVKKLNFVIGWSAEEVWRFIIEEIAKRPYRYRGLYIGPADDAGPDFIVANNDGDAIEPSTTIDIRCREQDDLDKWRAIPYPTRRLESEQQKIQDIIVASGVRLSGDNKVAVKFYGALRRNNLIRIGHNIKSIPSPGNREYFKPIPIESFTWQPLEELMPKVDW